jgi:hypothetical protein
MPNLWKQIKNIFSQPQESLTISLKETIQPISENKQEPVIKKIKRQVSYRKNPKFSEKSSLNE